ncbi:hypothetical protein WCE41_01930 [Luteimonas sp. MJ246]|uniref:hypothetical protein n=1 Tax=Luteimonas sp. MJ174 TaxID=3129237 RepID=UPI0031BB3CEA
MHPKLEALETNQTKVCAHLVPAMQRVTDALAHGYVHYVGGIVPLKTAPDLILKLQGRFPGLRDNKNQAHYKKTKGAPRHKLVAFANKSSSELWFYLLTDTPRDEDHERWCDARRKATRLELYQYQALQITKAGQPVTSWTWQLQRTVVEKLKGLSKISIRAKKPEAFLTLIQESRTWAGFAGVRNQRAGLRAALTEEWKRTMPSSTPPPEWPRLRYVQRVRTR